MTITRDGSTVITRPHRGGRGEGRGGVNAANGERPPRHTVSSMRNNRLRRAAPRLQHPRTIGLPYARIVSENPNQQ